jgi:hypothetical protein
MQPATVAADPRRRPEPLQMRQRRPDGDIVSFQETAVTREHPAHRDRLRCGKRGIEPRHRLPHPAIGKRAVDERIAEPCPRYGVMARQQPLQRVGVDLPRHTERGGLAPRPPTRRLAGRPSQVAGVVRRCRSRR